MKLIKAITKKFVKTYSECFGEEIISLDKLKENEFVLNLFHGPHLCF